MCIHKLKSIPPKTPGGEVGRGDVDDDKNEEENPNPEKEEENEAGST
jgi:hypothetical protein